MPCARAFLTSDCEIPNCLAIADGLTPALKAARTAFSLPVVNETAPSSPASWRRCGFASATGFSFAGLGGRRPRRSASVVTAASSASISTSSNRFSAPAKSFGKKWRRCKAKLSGTALPFGTAEGPAAVTGGGTEKRSGVVSAGRRVGIPPTMPPVAHCGNGWERLYSRPFLGSHLTKALEGQPAVDAPSGLGGDCRGTGAPTMIRRSGCIRSRLGNGRVRVCRSMSLSTVAALSRKVPSLGILLCCRRPAGAVLHLRYG